jgi:predicted cupin superfamily sugar epimerase
MTVDEICHRLNLTPHPREGGFFAETYRAEERLATDALPARYSGPRSISTAIYFLITADSCSRLHRLASDEIFHFYFGDPVEMVRLAPGGRGERIVLGTDLRAGMRPQVLVPRHVWQGARLLSGGRHALLGTTVAPGYDDADFEAGRRTELLRDWPQFADMIRALTWDE